MINKKCIECGKELFRKPKTSRLNFCSDDCRNSNYRKRNREKLKKVQSEFYKNNRDIVRATKRKWNNKNKEYLHSYYLKNKKHIEEKASDMKYRKALNSRTQAKRIVKKLGWEKICKICGEKENINLHHKDGNALNNEIKNLIYLCRKHHMEKHVKLNKLK